MLFENRTDSDFFESATKQRQKTIVKIDGNRTASRTKQSHEYDAPNHKVQYKFSHSVVMYVTLGNSNFASISSPSITVVRVQRSSYTHLTVALLTFLWPLELGCLILRVCSVLLLLGLLC